MFLRIVLRQKQSLIYKLGWLFLLLGGIGCQWTGAGSISMPTVAPLAAVPASSPTHLPRPIATYTSVPTLTNVPAFPTATPSPTPTLLPTITPNPYTGLSITELAARSYGGGEVQIEDELERNDLFTRYLISYPSDGLKIYGFINVPNEGSKFPVAIVLHGYIEPDEYKVEDYTTRYADKLAEAGYFVFHPNYRNHPPSDEGANPYRIGYAIDVLNLIAIIKTQSLDPLGTLRRADAEYIHLMGHSMGGGIALRVATVWPAAIRGVVLYGAMSGDEKRNYERIRYWSGERSWELELGASAEQLEAISPIYHLDRLQMPISIHHGGGDTVVPLAWSQELCQLLTEMGHPVECFVYEGQPHTFNGNGDLLFQERLVAFFKRY